MPVAALVPPANDAFVDAATLFDGTTAAPGAGSLGGTTIDATVQANEPNTGSPTVTRTVWYTWIAPTIAFDVTYALILETQSSNINLDTIIHVYKTPSGATTSDLTALTLVASDDDSGPGFLSLVSLGALLVPASSSLVLYVRVCMFGTSSPGPFTLAWSFLGEWSKASLRQGDQCAIPAMGACTLT